jgi:uncharacterized membrane protein YgcG
VEVGTADELAAPRDLRPAQLGIVLLGKVVLGHLGATLADLAHHGFVGLQEIAGDGPQDWLVTDLRGQAAAPRTLLPFEAALLDGLFAGQAELQVQSLGPELIAVLNRVRRLIRRDAVRHGWLQRLRRGHRTPRGEQLLAEIKTFRQQLRALAASGGLADRPDLEAYALLLGLPAPPAEDPESATGQDAAIPKRRLARFAMAWLLLCNQLDGPAAGKGHSDGFIHHWSAPAGHGHANHTHGGSGHGSYGGYSGGGHSGGFGGGGHGGH